MQGHGKCGAPESLQWMETGSAPCWSPSRPGLLGQGPTAKESVCGPLSLSCKDQTHPDTLVGLWEAG